MKEVEKTISSSSKDNFSRTLKVYPKVTPGIVSSINSQLEEAIQKASLPIQRHKNSKWVDNSYTLVGRSRYYKLDYENAIITFKYVNSISDNPDDKHEALTWLLRSFTQTEQYDNAFSVISFLGKENLTSKNKELFTLAKAELYQKIDDKKAFLTSMEEASTVVKNRNNKARISFIMAQLNQVKGNDNDAFQNYKRSIRKSPTYEMSFYAKLYMAQVTTLGKQNDNKKIIRFYKKLLRDEKNTEYKDKIYYEMGIFEHKQNHFTPALDYMKQSLRANTANQNQKAYSYLKMAEIYDEDLKDYRNAAYYYDSTLSVLAKDEANYESIQKRGEILKEFIEQVTIIETEDSLQLLASMDSLELITFLNKKIKEEEEKIKKEEEKKKKLLAQQSNNGNQSNVDLLNNSQNGKSSNWYFYNSSSINKGKIAFVQKWGDRPLEDNWRRLSKEKVLIEEEEYDDEEIDNAEVNNNSSNLNLEEVEEKRLAKKRAALMKSLPFSKEALNSSNARLEEAFYKLGRIYNLNLEEKQEASDTYEELLKRFPENENKLEIYYIIYLINKELDMNKSNNYKNILLNQYPNSIYAKLILDPEYLIKNEQLNKEAQFQYADAYKMHQNRLFDESTDLCNAIISKFPENDIMDKIVFLKALNIGLQDTTVLLFKTEVEKFIGDFPESELIPLAEEYLKGIDDFINKKISISQNVQNKESTLFKFDPNEVHYFVTAFDKKEFKQHKIQNRFAQYNDDNWATEKYKSLPMIFGNDKFLIVIQEFKNAKKAMNYYSTINVKGNILKEINSDKFNSFVISTSNFNSFFSSKKLDDYLSFFRNNYILNDDE